MGTHRLHPFILIVAASILACSDQGPRSPGSDGETSATGVAGSPGPMLTTPGPFSSNQSIAGGARLAEPGEFTERAFLAGRLDLTQAEAVKDLIESTTLHQARVAAPSVEQREQPPGLRAGAAQHLT